MSGASGKLVQGVGINDATFSVSPTVNGKTKSLPSYISWCNMLKRCYGIAKNPQYKTYEGCLVCDEWLCFSNFHEWYLNQYKEQGWHLDKDIITRGSRLYCPDNCVFVSPQINSFVINSGAARGDYLLGVSYDKRDNRFKAQCNNPFTKQKVHLGHFSDQVAAHHAWKRKKHQFSCQLAESVHDERLRVALETMYLPETNWED